ncbi:microsomal triglyceride transfer protein large subunit-like [Uloborus diversus]|uniref:microsomal triglyceride transfer protein large subunit-like n=1 Tax=Uloborus diversus TaxID=327109 RepID=UPI0024099FD7|nr:microsomal triglyceride transfer protein large subunit-like [Uloborus diversus]
MEMLEGGLLKRSVFDVNIESAEGMSNLLTVGMFAEGLASFAGSSSDDDSDQSPSAGMELTLLGSSLRPYIFFSSTSELMSHAWSGTASEPTPALQGIFLLSDDENVIVLSNGMIVRLETRAVLSTDLSASVQISLWSRNSQSQVKNAGALFVRSVAKIDSGVASTRAGFQFTGDSAIDFNTDLDFSDSPFKMCLQMNHPDITIRHDFQRSTQITGSKFLVKRTKKRKRFIPGKSFVLYPRNNEQCKEMNSE